MSLAEKPEEPSTFSFAKQLTAIASHPGRAQESVSECPYLNGLYASSFVKGIQGDVRYADKTVGKPLLAAATCKHLAVYNLEAVNYGGEHWTRHRFQANVSAQELEETYLPAFKACIMEGNSQQVMCSYNSIRVSGGAHAYNSTPACLNGDIQNRQMRGEWGFRGSIVSDCDALSDAHFAHDWGPGAGDGGNATIQQTVVAGLENGCDMDCGSFYSMYGPSAAAGGLLHMHSVDTALERIFLMRVRLGEFDPPETNPFGMLGGADTDTILHRDSALRAARESIVLLNNSASVLPLDAKKLKSVAVVGYLANCTRANGCAASGGGGVEMGGKNDYNPAFTVGPLDGIRARFGAVSFEPGVINLDTMNTSGFAAAEAAAKAADVTIAVVGLDGDMEGEGHDRGNTSLAGAQLELVEMLLAAVGPRKLVVVFVNGGSLSPDFVKNHCPTVVEAFYGGQSGGTALAEVLAGDYSPR